MKKNVIKEFKVPKINPQPKLKDIQKLESEVIRLGVEVARKERVIQQLQSDYEYLKQTSEATRTMHTAVKSEYTWFEKAVRIWSQREIHCTEEWKPYESYIM